MGRCEREGCGKLVGDGDKGWDCGGDGRSGRNLESNGDSLLVVLGDTIISRLAFQFQPLTTCDHIILPKIYR